MQELLRSTWLIARTQLPRTLLSRRVALCLFVALGPAALPLLVATFAPHESSAAERLVYPGLLLVLQVVVPVVALILGSAVVSEEIEDRTITYLFTRPLPRAALLFGRWLVVAFALALVLAASVLALGASAAYSGGGGPDAIPPKTLAPLLAMAVVGGLVYSALFAALGTFLKHPTIVGLAYAFTIEGFLANLPGKSQALTIQHYLRSHLALHGGAPWRELDVLREVTREPAQGALLTLAIVLVGALAIGAATIRRRQILLTS